MNQLWMDGRDVSPDLLSFTQELVRIQSYSGEEEQLAHCIAAKMEALGYDEVQIDRFGNVIGRVGDGEKTILFDSHTDTVKVWDPEAWDVPPFSGEIRDGFLWGRGSVDMKSGLAASVYAAVLARSQGLLDGKTVYVTCTVYEEYCDGEGLKQVLAERGLRPDFAIVCEPSSNVIVTGHKGKAQMLVKTRGVSAHGSAPEKGVNAIYEMAGIIQRVEQTNLALMQAGGSHGTLVLSQISSTSVSLNAVPSACEIYLDRRMVVGESEQTVRAEMEAIIAGKDGSWELGSLQVKTWTGEELRYEPLHPAWEISRDHVLAQAFIAASADVLGQAPDGFDYWDFSTNAVALVSQGIATIGLGPGEYKLAHMRNERCELGQIAEACAIYTRVIGRL